MEGKKGHEEPQQEHPIFKQDPNHWMQYVSKKVCILTENGHSYTGWVFTVDPVSSTFVLVQFTPEGKAAIEIVIGHAVKQVDILEAEDLEDKLAEEKSAIGVKLDSLFADKSRDPCSESDLEARKELLKSWLLKNRLPVEETDDRSLRIANVVTVTPPYTPDTCISLNEIILAKIQGLIKNIPNDSDFSAK